ncbi:hypothetical protein [Qaidamihabitans albus]|uniref:hypothetical protein n=1 Tax=Qaidamihabitans albus TaxID=2795733 RepID=UPI0018F23602|nr:hypothetical protein [Qaidamihabitans albus]
MSTPLGRVRSWHRPMTWFAGVMLVMAAVSAAGLALDDRVLLGAPIWLKPLKFAVSISLYCITWAWLTSLLRRHRRVASVVSTAIVVLLAVEYAVIVVQAVRGRSSHFNVSTALDSTLFTIMAVSIAALWTGTLVLTVLLVRTPVADAAGRWAIRLGALIALAGLALGALMTRPTSAQVESMADGTFEGLVGAHSVGVPDGGPGMAVTGWSTTGGDLRIPHFVGMHALQALPLLALLLGALATRLPRLRSGVVRTRLVLTAAAGYAGLTGLLTWQALRGQPLTAPDPATLLAFGLLAGAVVVAAGLCLVRTPDGPPEHLDGDRPKAGAR